MIQNRASPSLKPQTLTCKTSGYEDPSKAPEAAHKRRALDVPVPPTDVLMFCVHTTIDEDAEDNE